MGYGLRFDGLGAFEALIRREAALNGRPYSAYCFLLAQETDVKGVELLQEFSREIDQITAEGIAFLVLLDRLEVDGTFHVNPRWQDPTPQAELAVDLPASCEIFEKVSTRDGSNYGWTSRWQISGTKSVDFARACGLPLDNLPCLINFDAAEIHDAVIHGRDAFSGVTIPITDNPDRHYARLRRACAAFYEEHREDAALLAMREWDRAVAESRRLSVHLQRLRQAQDDLLTQVHRFRPVSNAVSLLGPGPKYLESRPALPTDELQVVDTFLAEAHSLREALKGWKAMPVRDRDALLQSASFEVKRVMDGLSIRDQMPVVVSRLDRLISTATQKRKVLEEPIRSYAASALAEEIDATSSQLQHLGAAQERCLRTLGVAARPRFGPLLEAEMKREQWAARRINLRVQAANASEWLKWVVDTIGRLSV